MPKAGSEFITEFDPFALTRGDDEELLTLFRQWVEAERATAKFGRESDDEEEFSIRCDDDWELMRRVASVPAVSAVGLAIKAYMFVWLESGGSNYDAPGITGLGGDEYYSTQMLLSVVRDLPAFVPEMAPLIRYATQKGYGGAAESPGNP